MEAVHAYAKLSKAIRLKVGALLVKDDRIISLGYNGTPSGYDNFCEYSDTYEGVGSYLRTKPEVVHAETNVIAFAAKNGIKTDGCTLILTHSPCFDCSRLIIQSGVKTVVYKEDYRDLLGIEFLRKNNVEVVKYEKN